MNYQISNLITIMIIRSDISNISHGTAASNAFVVADKGGGVAAFIANLLAL
jgi:hypothetical protein